MTAASARRDGDRLARACKRLLGECRPRAGSLAISIFGDSIAAQGGSVWLGSLVMLMQSFGLNARQTRTALFRLVQEGWLRNACIGRRSFYRFTPPGERQYARAAERIYAASVPQWDGYWTLVMIARVPADARELLRRQLAWQGFASIAPGVLGHPHADDGRASDIAQELGVADKVVVWRAQADVKPALSTLVDESWDLRSLAARFAQFIACFAPVRTDLEHTAVLDPRAAFVIRTLVVHEYRRILLRATALPRELLPAAWPGHLARELAAALYARVHVAASDYASSVLCNEQGALPGPAAAFFARFGGLDARSAPAPGSRFAPESPAQHT